MQPMVHQALVLSGDSEDEHIHGLIQNGIFVEGVEEKLQIVKMI